MNDNRTDDEKYADWINAVSICWQSNWKCVQGWVFESPSRTKHDLSAADLSKLDRIEANGLFAA